MTPLSNLEPDMCQYTRAATDPGGIFKGTHTVYFSSSLYIINQKPMIPRTHFHCITT